MTLFYKCKQYLRALSYEEQHKSVVLISAYRYTIELALEMIRVVGALHSDLVQVDILHFLNEVLAINVAPHSVEHLD